MTSKKTIRITKSSGELVHFDIDKLRNSLQKSGAHFNVIESIIEIIQNELYPGMTTREIYKRAFSLLKKNSRPTAARYKLKRAIMELGPSGFPFELLVAELLKQEGYSCEVGIIVQGHCVSHELDVFAQKSGHQLLIECKYNSDPNGHSNVKVPLYIHSRFRDIEQAWSKNKDFNPEKLSGAIYTNTRFSSDAIQYAQCSGIGLFGWDFPKKNSLKERIDKTGLHPITCLTSLTTQEKKKLLEKLIVLSSDLARNPSILDAIIPTTPLRREKIIQEAKALSAH
jgi:hypothetical protein